MINFQYLYDKDKHSAKLVIVSNAFSREDKEYFVSKIICEVKTETSRQDVPPKFVVKGTASKITLDLVTDTLYIE